MAFMSVPRQSWHVRCNNLRERNPVGDGFDDWPLGVAGKVNRSRMIHVKHRG